MPDRFVSRGGRGRLDLREALGIPAPEVAPTPEEFDRLRLERAFGHDAPDGLAQRWLALPDRDWVMAHAANMYQAGLCPAQAETLRTRLTRDGQCHATRLVDAGRYAGLDAQYMHLWAIAGLLPAMRQNNSFTAWIRKANGYISACGGSEHAAALFAAAGVSEDEARAQVATGQVDLAALETLVALIEMPLPEELG